MHDWKKLFCNTEQAIGVPNALLVTSSAMGAVNIIRQLPNFNKVGTSLRRHCLVPLVCADAHQLVSPPQGVWLLLQACRIGKLFAKHFKVAEQQDFLAVQPVCLAVGTPHRLLELAELASLKLDKLKLILLDVQLDAKQRCDSCD